MFNTSGPDRPSIDDTLLLFADGRAHDQKVMFEEAEKLKANGVKILSVGYGTNITLTNFKTNLIKMATNKKDTFIVDFKNNDLKLEEQIEVIAKHLVEVDCPRGYSGMLHVFIPLAAWTIRFKLSLISMIRKQLSYFNAVQSFEVGTTWCVSCGVV